MLSCLIFLSLVTGGSSQFIHCNGQPPLQYGGFNLFCGAGSSSCPVGSYCELGNDGTAVCCSNLVQSFGSIAPLPSPWAFSLPSWPIPSLSPGLPYPSLPSWSISPFPSAFSSSNLPSTTQQSLYASPSLSAQQSLYTSPSSTSQQGYATNSASAAASAALPLPASGICPDTGKQKLSCPINSCLTSDCLGVPGASCMVDYCGNCGPKWYGPYNQVLTPDQCNWIPAWSARLQAFSAQQQQQNSQSSSQASSAQSPQQFASFFPAFAQQQSSQFFGQNYPAQSSQQSSAQTSAQQQSSTQGTAGNNCPAPPDCRLDFLNPPGNQNQTRNNRQSSGTPAQNQDLAWQQQAQQTSCQYKNPLTAPNGCLMSCGTLVCNGPVRFIQIAVGQGSAVATWVPPLSAALGQTYTVDMSYDNTTWRNLTLEQPWATFARFQVDQGKSFIVRVNASGYPSSTKSYIPQNVSTSQSNSQINNRFVSQASQSNGASQSSGLQSNGASQASQSSGASQSGGSQSTAASQTSQSSGTAQSNGASQSSGSQSNGVSQASQSNGASGASITQVNRTIQTTNTTIIQSSNGTTQVTNTSSVQSSSESIESMEASTEAGQ